MPNLKAKLVTRNKQSVHGNRNYVSLPQDPKFAGPFYIQYCVGSHVKFDAIPAICLTDAERAVDRKKAELRGNVGQPPTPVQELPSPKHTLAECADSYRNWQEDPTTVNCKGKRYKPKAINERCAAVARFLANCPAVYIEDVTRKHLEDWARTLRGESLESFTVHSKVMMVVHFLGNNQVVERKGFVKGWTKPTYSNGGVDPVAHPYTEAEISAMMTQADLLDKKKQNGGQYHFMLRTLLATGMRLGELTHLEASDLEGNVVKVRDKSKRLDWSPKTGSSVRAIRIDAGLAAELKAFRQTGLLFPSPRGLAYEQGNYRVLEEIAKKAGVVVPVGEAKADWTHRWRDTFATEQMRAGVSLRDLCKILGHKDTKSIDHYAAYGNLDSPEVVRAAALSNRYAKKEGDVILFPIAVGR